MICQLNNQPASQSINLFGWLLTISLTKFIDFKLILNEYIGSLFYFWSAQMGCWKIFWPTPLPKIWPNVRSFISFLEWLLSCADNFSASHLIHGTFICLPISVGLTLIRYYNVRCMLKYSSHTQFFSQKNGILNKSSTYKILKLAPDLFSFTDLKSVSLFKIFWSDDFYHKYLKQFKIWHTTNMPCSLYYLNDTRFIYESWPKKKANY